MLRCVKRKNFERVVYLDVIKFWTLHVVENRKWGCWKQKMINILLFLLKKIIYCKTKNEERNLFRSECYSSVFFCLKKKTVSTYIYQTLFFCFFCLKKYCFLLYITNIVLLFQEKKHVSKKLSWGRDRTKKDTKRTVKCTRISEGQIKIPNRNQRMVRQITCWSMSETYTVLLITSSRCAILVLLFIRRFPWL